ncbi:MAG: hypothetical protein KDA89_23365 [Planctomycetaceae bacterium]|nr:hypothetical protein [Planctomycetaceae bacterium]
MSRSPGNIIVDSLQLSVGYAERLLKDIPADRFARFAANAEGTVNSNHAAFVYGHLCLYPERIVKQLGKDSAGVAVPEKYTLLFSKDARCQDDPEGSVYPAADEITEFFFRGYRLAAEALREADDATLQQPNPMPGPMAEKFPTLGSMHNFYVGGHMMLHLGQLSAWRRMWGLPPA